MECFEHVNYVDREIHTVKVKSRVKNTMCSGFVSTTNYVITLILIKITRMYFDISLFFYILCIAN